MRRNLLMNRYLMAVVSLMFATSMFAGKRYTFNFDVQRTIDAAEESVCEARPSLLKSLIGLSNPSSAILRATWVSSTGSETFYETSTTDDGTKGHWFAKSGIATTKAKNYCIKVVWKAPNFYVSHNQDANVEEGGTYTVKEALINGTDTIVYVFNVSIGQENKVTTDQPYVMGRKSITDDWLVRPVVRQNEQDPKNHNWIQVNAGDKITLGCEIIDTKTYESGKYSWVKHYWNASTKKEATKTVRNYSSSDFVLTESAEYEDGGMYELIARLSPADGSAMKIVRYYYFVDVQEHPGEFHKFESPKLSYDFHTEYPTLQKPTKIHTVKKKSGKPANSYAGEWWSVFWGDNLNKEVGTDSATIYGAAKNLVAKYDKDFEYIRDYMGWPPDLSARNGYKSFVYIFGSGLANDNESNTTQGGYQSSTNVDGRNYACVWASYYPFSRFRDDARSKWSDVDYQCDAMVHEGIHAIFADLNACQGSSWFHEGGNTWLQGQVYARRDGKYGDAGFLDGGPFLAPHMPIECYSGWLQDGSYGGPAAQGVNMYANTGAQVCTWRGYLGGVQYANAFPTVLAAICGDGCIPWIWRYCKNRVLETIADSIGDEAMRRIILEYRCRQALFDLDGWDNSYRSVANSYFGTSIRAEWRNGVCSRSGGEIVGRNTSSDQMSCWIDVEPYKLTPYSAPELNDTHGWLAPDTLTNPGWSGGNVIPIHVSGNVANVEFRPEDTNMRAQLCYRTKSGKCYYSQPVFCGNMSIDITDAPANGVIFCVVANTDYVYTGDAQRKHHWDYRIRLGEGALGVADPYIKWYYYEQTLKDNNFIAGIKDVEVDKFDDLSEKNIKVMSGNVKVGEKVLVDLDGINPSNVSIRIVGLQGAVVKAGKLNADGTFTMPSNVPAGLYVVTFSYNGQRQVVKLIAK